MPSVRRVLVAVTGLTPQVVTETIFALATRKPDWIPDEVHVLTTLTGAELARQHLLAAQTGQFHRLCADYELGCIAFGESHIHVLCDTNGRGLEDIRSPSDNMAMADAILAKIAGITADPSSELHVSLAGGRKSMGFFAGYALSLYGRPQDRLSHVLVSPGFETHPAFFFPPRIPVVLSGRNGESLNTADARVDLAEIPFVRLRDRLPMELIAGGRFADAVAAAQRLESPSLFVSTQRREIICSGARVKLSALNFAIYAWHAWRTKTLPEPGIRLAQFNMVKSPLRRELFEYGKRLYPNPHGVDAEHWDNARLDADHANFSQWLAEKRSRINEAIRRTVGKAGERMYGIASETLAGKATSHRLLVPPDAIEFEE